MWLIISENNIYILVVFEFFFERVRKHKQVEGNFFNTYTDMKIIYIYIYDTFAWFDQQIHMGGYFF